mmetsp:Transcript_71100/g.169711  ORF Transcript_71100/g.169711 Transcript_71100/m.169711 type:complete len:290 (-) Transcript_71100:488-1357(-)
MPSSSAALVAFSASFRRSLVSFTSTSLAPPTLMTATPPLNLARRSFILSFSYSEVDASMPSLMLSHRSSILSFSPVPSRMTVLSLSMEMVLALPNWAKVASSSFPPSSSVISSAPVSTARSCRMAFRLSPKPGALMAATLRPPLSLFTMSIERASPSTSSAMSSRGLLALATCSSTGRMACTEEIFLSKISTNGFSISTFCAFTFVMKYGEMYPRSSCMPSTTSSSWSMVFPSDTVMVPSLPTFSKASVMSRPICSSPLAAMVATLLILSGVSIIVAWSAKSFCTILVA